MCWCKPPIPDHSSNLGVLALLKVEIIGSCLWSFPLWNSSRWSCVFVCLHACTHSQLPASVPYRFSHSRLAEKTGKSPELYLNCHTTNNLFILIRNAWRQGSSYGSFPTKTPSQLYKNLCLSFKNNLTFNCWPREGFLFHLQLMMLLKCCNGTSTAILPLHTYSTIQGDVVLFQK